MARVCCTKVNCIRGTRHELRREFATLSTKVDCLMLQPDGSQGEPSRPSTLEGDLWREFAALRSIVLEGRDTNYGESLQP